MKIYVGILPWSVGDAALYELFAEFGAVELAQSDAQQAIAKLNGQTVDSRELRVNEAQSKPRR